MEESPCQRFVKDLTGVWNTESAEGHFPTLVPFRFGAEFSVSRVPVRTKAAFVHTTLESWPPGKRGEVGMHYENGFLRCVGPDAIEWNIAHNFGVAEVAKGTVSETGASRVAQFESTSIANASHVKATRRVLAVDAKAGVLQDTFYMATTDVPTVTEHLKTTYLKSQRKSRALGQ